MPFGRHLFVKLSATGVTDILGNALQHGITQRLTPSRYSPAHRAPASNVVSTGQLGLGAVGTAFGEDAQAIVAALMPIITPIAKEYGIDLGKTFAVGTAPPRSQVQEHSQITSRLMQQQLAENATAFRSLAENIGNMTGSFLDMVPVGDDGKAQLAGFKNAVINRIQSAPPEVIGTVAQGFMQAIPEFQVWVQATMPEMVFDYTPLVDLTYQQNGGEWSDDLFLRNVRESDRAYAKDFAPAGYASKQDMLYAAQVASEMTGRASFSPSATLNVMNSAQAFRAAGMADSFGDALEVAKAIAPDAARNPNAAIQQASWINAQSRKFGINPKEYTQAASIARDRGIPLSTAMSALTYGRRMEQQLKGTPQAYQADLAAETLTTMNRSEAGKILQAAVQAGKLSPEGARQIASSAHSPQRLQARLKTLLRDPTVSATWRQADATPIVSGMDPEALARLNASEAHNRLARSPGGARLQKMLSDPGRSAMLAKGVYTGLKPQEINLLQSATGRKLMSALQASRLPSATPKRLDTTPIQTINLGATPTVDNPTFQPK